MKIIAFKRAGNNPSLHSEFITEYIDSKYLESTEGYETLLEDEFNKELSKNEDLHNKHVAYLREQELLALKAREAAALNEDMELKEFEREFKRFQAWKKMSGNKK